jgi:hypothetical protein
MWNVEFTRKNVPSNKMIDGSGAKPGIMGLMEFDDMLEIAWKCHENRQNTDAKSKTMGRM